MSTDMVKLARRVRALRAQMTHADSADLAILDEVAAALPAVYAEIDQLREALTIARDAIRNELSGTAELCFEKSMQWAAAKADEALGGKPSSGRAAVLAFLDGLDDDAIARVAAKTCLGKMNIAEVIAALRAALGGKP